MLVERFVPSFHPTLLRMLPRLLVVVCRLVLTPLSIITSLSIQGVTGDF